MPVVAWITVSSSPRNPVSVWADFDDGAVRYYQTAGEHNRLYVDAIGELLSKPPEGIYNDHIAGILEILKLAYPQLEWQVDKTDGYSRLFKISLPEHDFTQWKLIHG